MNTTQTHIIVIAIFFTFVCIRQSSKYSYIVAIFLDFSFLSCSYSFVFKETFFLLSYHCSNHSFPFVYVPGKGCIPLSRSAFTNVSMRTEKHMVKTTGLSEQRRIHVKRQTQQLQLKQLVLLQLAPVSLLQCLPQFCLYCV